MHDNLNGLPWGKYPLLFYRFVLYLYPTIPYSQKGGKGGGEMKGRVKGNRNFTPHDETSAVLQR